MERVYHIHIVKIGCSGFVCYIHRMLQRQIPDRECLEFGIPGFDAFLVVLIKLAETNCHLAAAWSGSRHHHQRARCLHIIVLAESLIGIDKLHIVRIPLDGVMIVGFDVQTFQAVAESLGALLPLEVRNDNRTNLQTAAFELVAQTEYIHVVGDADIAAHFVFFDVHRTDDNHNLSIIAQLHQHLQLAVGVKTGQNTAGMKVVEQLAAKLQIKLVAKLCYTLLYMLRLNFYVFLVVKTKFHLSVFCILTKIVIFLRIAEVITHCINKGFAQKFQIERKKREFRSIVNYF